MFNFIFRRPAGDFIEVKGVKVYNGFPYLMTELTPGFYHIILLPSRWKKKKLHRLAHSQVKANQLVSYLMINKNEFHRYSAESQNSIKAEQVDTPPAAELYFCGRLYPAENIPETSELIARKKNLIKLVQAQLDSGRYVEIDERALGGKKPDEEELKELSGYYFKKPQNEIPRLCEDDYKVPAGLIECEKCRWYKGRALYPNATNPRYVVPVLCRCEDNTPPARCARCGEILYHYRLNSNYFSHIREGIVHFSGYRALGHVCKGFQTDYSRPQKSEQDRFKPYSDEYLVELYNHETMKPGWVFARGIFLARLTREFLSRGIDISQIINESGGFLFGHRNFGVLFGKKVINMRYLVRMPDDPGISRDPQVMVKEGIPIFYFGS